MVSLQNFLYLCTIKYYNDIMENDMPTMAARPLVAYPMTSYKDVTRTCPLSPTEKEVHSSYMDSGRITSLYVYGYRGETVAIDEILAGLAELRIMDLWLDKGDCEEVWAFCLYIFVSQWGRKRKCEDKIMWMLRIDCVWL